MLLSNIKNNFKFTLLGLFFILICTTFILNFDNYIGYKSLFFIFHLSCLSLFLVAIRKNASAFEFFLYLFLLLSFWFKFSCILYFDDFKVSEGNFNLNNNNYDKTTFIIIVTFIACILASFTKDIISTPSHNTKKFFLKNTFKLFYTKYRVLLYFLVIGFLLSLWVSNSYYNIYSKGLVNQNINPYIKHIYAYSLTYGLSLLVSTLIYIDFHIFEKKKIFILGFFEAFFTNLTIFSRSFILISFVYTRGFFLLLKPKMIKSISKNFILKFITLILVLFFISFYSTHQLRNKFFYKEDNSRNIDTQNNVKNEFLSIATNRWVGIDGLLSVSQYNNLSFNFFLEAWNERINIKKKSFYVKHFFNSFEFEEKEKENLNIVITPGFIAFLFYSGSALFVFFTVFFLILTCSFVEKFFYMSSSGNIILSNIIGYALALRLIHFGYVPINTINFIFSFLVTLIIIRILSKIIWKK